MAHGDKSDGFKTNESDGFRPSEKNVAYIGEGVSLKGEISVPDVFVVDGGVEGDVTARAIHVGPEGSVKGNIVSTDADIHGTITEKIEVKQLLTVRSTGRIEGSVSYGEVQIERGAVIAGTFSSTDFRSEKRLAKPDQSVSVDKVRQVIGQQADQGSAKTGVKVPFSRGSQGRESESVRTTPLPAPDLKLTK